MVNMEKIRARLEQEDREKRTKQLGLFASAEAPESHYYRLLRERYLDQAKSRVKTVLTHETRITYDKAWQIWLQYPLVWESDLEDWVVKSNDIEIQQNLKQILTKPQRGKNHILVRVEKTTDEIV